MKRISVKEKLLNYFFNQVYNTLTVPQARARFGIENVSARISELREDGFTIYTNTRVLDDGRKIKFYRLGSPSYRYLRNHHAGRTNLAKKTLFKQVA